MSQIVPLSPNNMVEVADISQLPEADKQKVIDISNSIDIRDTQTALQYGVNAQVNISRFADNVLNQIRAKDAGYVGEVLTDLMLKVKDMNVDSLSGKPGFLESLPILGGLMNSAKKFIAKYDKMNVQIENIVDELDKTRMQLLKDLTVLDKLFESNLEYFHELNLYIAAGEMKIKELQDTFLPSLKAKAENSTDMLAAQEYNDMTQFINRFEKKLHDLKLSRTICLQTAPQIRLVQGNNQLLVEKIQSSILNTIPLWKNQMIIAISLLRQKKALEIQKEVSQTTNDLLLKNAELLKTNTIETAKEGEKGIVEIETLKKVNADLITTIEETLKIQQEGSLKRKQAEQELSKIEQELKDKLASLKR